MESATKPADSTLNNEPTAVVIKREPEQDLVTWSAASRPFKRYGRKFYVTIFSIVGIISIILFVAEGVMPVILLVSLIFLFYVLSTVAPENIEYKITNKGVKIAGKETPWQNITRFSLGERSGSEVLAIETVTFPNKIEMVIDPMLKDRIKKEISAYAPYENIPPSTLDKVVQWVVKKLPESE